MYKKALHLLAVIAAGISMMVASCGDDVVESSGVNTGARLNVVVRDAVTGQAQLGAKVTLLSDQGRDYVYTLTNGYATFDDVYVGEHQVLVESSPGYAAIIVPVTIKRDMNTSQDQYYVALDETVEVPLYPLTATLTGEINYPNDKGESVPAVGATIRITFADNLVVKSRDTITGAGGKFTITGLPAGANYTLEALNYSPPGMTSDIVYPRFELASGQELKAGDVTQITSVEKYPPKLSTFRYIGWTGSKTVAAKDSIVLDFSAALDTAAIGLHPLTTSPVQAVDIKYSGSKIILKPYGEWNSGFTISLAGKIVSTAGDVITYIDPLTVVLGQADLSLRPAVVAWIDSTLYPASVSPSNTPQWGSSTVPLRWGKVADATGYEIYVKNSLQTAYTLAKTHSSVDTFTTVSIPGGALEGKTFQYVVRGTNNRSKTPLEGAVPVPVVSRPTVTNALSDGNSAVINGIAMSNLISYLTSGTASPTTTPWTMFINFSEEMDRTATVTPGWAPIPAGDVTATAVAARIAVVHSWVNESGVADNKKMRLSVSVIAGAAIDPAPLQNVNIKFNFAGLVSAAGKPFFVEYVNNNPTTGKMGKEVKQALDVAFDFRVLPPVTINFQSVPSMLASYIDYCPANPSSVTAPFNSSFTAWPSVSGSCYLLNSYYDNYRQFLGWALATDPTTVVSTAAYPVNVTGPINFVGVWDNYPY